MSTFVRAQLDLDVFLTPRVRAFFRNTCVMYGLLRLTFRYVLYPPLKGILVYTYICDVRLWVVPKVWHDES